MSEKRYKFGIIKGSRQAHIIDCHTCKSATIDVYDDNIKYFVDKLNELSEENEQLRMKLKGDDYIMVSEMLSNLRKTGICDGCKNKDKPVEWYLERGFSITGRVCDLYEPEV